MAFYENIVLDYDDNGTEGSGSLEEIDSEWCDIAISQSFQRVFLPTIYGIIFTLGIVGNGLVVLVMGFQKKCFQKNTMDRYRLHLSVADLLFVFTLPFWAVDAASTWRFGNFMCVAVHMIYTVNLYSSLLILTFISLDRYLAIVRATNSHATRNLLAEKVIYVGVWLPAILLTVPDLVFAKVQSTGVKDICERIYPEEANMVWKAFFRFQHIFMGFVLPGLSILFCYCVIISRLSRGYKGKPQKRKALKTTIILILCFFICWLPYCIGILVDTLTMLNIISPSCYLDQSMQQWIFITEPLAYFHCCLNPILYAFLGVKFKKSARNTLTASSRSSQKALTKKRGIISSVSTESESSSALSS